MQWYKNCWKWCSLCSPCWGYIAKAIRKSEPVML
jgi:hypothetical protein